MSDERAKELILLPKDYLSGPFFPVKAERGTRSISVRGRKYEMGGFDKFGVNEQIFTLTVADAKVLFCVLKFRDPSRPGVMSIRFSLSQLCRKLAKQRGGSYDRSIRDRLDKLERTWIRATYENGEEFLYRCFERVVVHHKPIRRKDSKRAQDDRQREIWLEEIRLSPEFHDLLFNLAEVQEFRLDVFLSISSRIAQAIYTYLPSRAYHHPPEEKPFEITLARLLTDIGADVPSAKSRRHRLFTQNEHPILDQLNGLETVTGTLITKLAETKDKKDWKLQAWVKPSRERLEPRKPQGALWDVWKKNSRPDSLFETRLLKIKPLLGYNYDMMEELQVEYVGSVRFFEQAKALLGQEGFDSKLSALKGSIREGQEDVKKPTGLFISRLIEAVENL